MTVKELKEFLSNCPDDMEVRYETEMGIELVKAASIEICAHMFNYETQERKLCLTTPFVYLY